MTTFMLDELILSRGTQKRLCRRVTFELSLEAWYSKISLGGEVGSETQGGRQKCAKM